MPKHTYACIDIVHNAQQDVGLLSLGHTRQTLCSLDLNDVDRMYVQQDDRVTTQTFMYPACLCSTLYSSIVSSGVGEVNPEQEFYPSADTLHHFCCFVA